VNRKLASSILTKRPDDQRPRRHHPLDQFRPNRRPARIAEIPKFPDRTQNGISLQEMPHRFKLLQFGQMNCVNAVGIEDREKRFAGRRGESGSLARIEVRWGIEPCRTILAGAMGTVRQAALNSLIVETVFDLDDIFHPFLPPN
jgi:hypothetical protein